MVRQGWVWLKELCVGAEAGGCQGENASSQPPKGSDLGLQALFCPGSGRGEAPPPAHTVKNSSPLKGLGSNPEG